MTPALFASLDNTKALRVVYRALRDVGVSKEQGWKADRRVVLSVRRACTRGLQLLEDVRDGPTRA